MTAAEEPLNTPMTGLNVPVSSVPSLRVNGVSPFPNATALPATSRPPPSVMLAALCEPDSVRAPAPDLTSDTLESNVPAKAEFAMAATVSVPEPVMTPPGNPLRLPMVGENSPRSSVPEPTVRPAAAGPRAPELPSSNRPAVITVPPVCELLAASVRTPVPVLISIDGPTPSRIEPCSVMLRAAVRTSSRVDPIVTLPLKVSVPASLLAFKSPFAVNGPATTPEIPV